MRMTVLADAYLNRVTLKTRCPKHWQMLRYGHLRSDASSTTTTPVGFCQCARVKSVGVAWPEVLRDISQVDPNGHPPPFSFSSCFAPPPPPPPPARRPNPHHHRRECPHQRQQDHDHHPTHRLH